MVNFGQKRAANFVLSLMISHVAQFWCITIYLDFSFEEKIVGPIVKLI